MFNLFNNILILLGEVIAFVHLDSLLKLASSVSKYIYTGSIKRKFASFGKRSLIIPSLLSFRGGKYISIGNNTIIGKSVQLTAWDKYREKYYTPSIIIGSNCNIRAYSHITAINEIIIGDNLLTGTNVLISDNSHGILSESHVKIPPSERDLNSKGKIQIGNNVWVGNNVIILANVKIGDGVIIGANSVVTSDIPAYSVAVGVPAKIVKQIKVNENE